MYKVEEETYGIKTTIQGFIKPEEIQKWSVEMKEALNKAKKDFCVYADMRGYQPASEEVQRILVDVQSSFKKAGLRKSVVILDQVIATMQMKRLAKESGVHEYERYISPENNPQWEQQALGWLTKDVDPDK